MADVFSVTKRSEIMSRVRGRGNKATELALVALLRRHRITGWRRHLHIFGNPDFVFTKCRVAVFVDGCFWHGCAMHAAYPMNNRAFWTAKLARNKARDRLVIRTLRNDGWRVLRVWQHELSRKNEQRLLRRLRAAISTGKLEPRPRS
jgi:DNA mismatch endonuclease (patch repair protein)